MSIHDVWWRRVWKSTYSVSKNRIVLKWYQSEMLPSWLSLQYCFYRAGKRRKIIERMFVVPSWMWQRPKQVWCNILVILVNERVTCEKDRECVWGVETVNRFFWGWKAKEELDWMSLRKTRLLSPWCFATCTRESVTLGYFVPGWDDLGCSGRGSRTAHRRSLVCRRSRNVGWCGMIVQPTW